MLCESYIEALLVDPDQADRVWQDWYGGLISDAAAAQEWSRIVEVITAVTIINNDLEKTVRTIPPQRRLCL